MYLNGTHKEYKIRILRLTLTWDVFKWLLICYNMQKVYRLTLTWDVFKSWKISFRRWKIID